MAKKWLIPTITALLLSQASFPVAAAEIHEVPYSEILSGTEKGMHVTWENPLADVNCTVTIPKNLALGAANKSQEYAITAKGNLNPETKLKVSPKDAIADTADTVDFLMHRTDKTQADVVATVVQAETEWLASEVTADGTSKSGTITAEDLTYGSWEGDLAFQINLYDTVTGEVIGGSGGSGENPDTPHEHNYVDGICTICNQEHDHTYEEELLSGGHGQKSQIKYTCECGKSYEETVTQYHTFDEHGFCTTCTKPNMAIFSTPGLYSFDHPTLRLSWVEMQEKAVLQPEKATTESGVIRTLDALEMQSLNPNLEDYILVLPESIITIGSRQFYAEDLGKIPHLKAVIAPGVTKVGAYAFGSKDSSYAYTLHALWIPNVVSVENYGFGATLEHLYISDQANGDFDLAKNAFPGINVLHYDIKVGVTINNSPWGAGRISFDKPCL